MRVTEGKGRGRTGGGGGGKTERENWRDTQLSENTEKS